MRNFNAITGNSARNPWSIGIGKFNPISMTITNICEKPILSKFNIPDLSVGFTADPFHINVNNIGYIFYEAWNNYSGKGEIAVAELNQYEAVHKAIVLDESFHLSYPNVFCHRNNYYLLPEAWESGNLILYRSKKFPYVWEKYRSILSIDYADPQIYFHNNIWYIFLTNDPLTNSTMSIFYSEVLEGPWKPHKKNPVILNNSKRARCAGRFFNYFGKIFRFSQDCSEIYGKSIYVQRLTNLSPIEFKETTIGAISIEDLDWCKTAVHHIDIIKRNNDLIVIYDGYTKCSI